MIRNFPAIQAIMRKPKKIQNGELVVVVVAEHGLATTMLKIAYNLIHKTYMIKAPEPYTPQSE